jgi:hypothetical protein
MPKRRERSKRIELGKLCIGEKIYTVYIAQSGVRGGLPRDHWGRIIYEDMDILISTEALKSNRLFLSTLIHEIIHAVLEDKFDDRSSEKIASTLDDPLAHALLSFAANVKDIEKARYMLALSKS